MDERTSPPRPGWLAQLDGHEFDLACWERSLKPPFDPWCERIPHGESSFLALRSHSFDDRSTPEEVNGRAETLIAQLNGALGVGEDAEPVKLRAVGRVEDKGQVNFTVFAKGVMRGRSMMTATAEVRNSKGDLVPPPPPAPSTAQKWVKAAENNDVVADMLTFAGRSDNWFDIYKAIQLAEKLVGERKLPGLLGQSGTEFKRMRRSANFYRHPSRHLRYPPPSVLTTLDEAKPLLSLAVRTVLDQPSVIKAA
jgi:hypothetical protein